MNLAKYITSYIYNFTYFTQHKIHAQYARAIVNIHV